MKIFGLIVLFLVLLLIVVFVVMRSRNKSTDNVENQVIDITPAKPEEIPASEPLVNGQNDSNTGNESDATTESKHYAADCESNCTAPIERKKVDTGELAHILVAEDNLSNYKLVEVMLRNIAVTENAINGKVADEENNLAVLTSQSISGSRLNGWVTSGKAEIYAQKKNE